MKKWVLRVIFLSIGAIGGFLYWYFVGCTSGSCPIQSVWYYTVLWGAALGYLVGDLVLDFINRRKKDA